MPFSVPLRARHAMQRKRKQQIQEADANEKLRQRHCLRRKLTLWRLLFACVPVMLYLMAHMSWIHHEQATATAEIADSNNNNNEVKETITTRESENDNKQAQPVTKINTDNNNQNNQAIPKPPPAAVQPKPEPAVAPPKPQAVVAPPKPEPAAAEKQAAPPPAKDAEKAPVSLEGGMKDPVITLMLEGTGLALMQRYFECGGFHDKLGRYWTDIHNTGNPNRKPIGQCMLENMQQNPNGNILKGCGNYHIWHEIGFRKPPQKGQPARCFDPVLYPGALEKLYEAVPKATIIFVSTHPMGWLDKVDDQAHQQWNDWCNPAHDIAFPADKHGTAYARFRGRYQDRIVEFVKSHPGWKLVIVNRRDSSPQAEAAMLHQHLGIPEQCYLDAEGDKLYNYDVTMDGGIQKLPRKRKLPDDVNYPIISVSLPLAGSNTIHNYFSCNLGDWASSFMSYTSTEPPYDNKPLSECVSANIEANTPPFENCGMGRVFAEYSTHKHPDVCFFPVLETNGLEPFAKAYPRGTLLMTVRNATAWAKSVDNWHKFNLRVGGNPACRQKELFPKPEASFEVWEKMYQDSLARVRDFAKEHPTMTYIEVPLTDHDEMGHLMDSIFGFHESCWAQAKGKMPIHEKDVIKGDGNQ